METHVEIEIDYQRDALTLVQQFIKEKLSNDLLNLATFDLASIRDDGRFGNSDKHLGIENMKICKAIYALVGNTVDNDLTYDKLLFGRGYQMGLIATVLDLCRKGGANNEEDLHLFRLPIDLLEVIDFFKEQTYTIGNVYVRRI